MSLSPDISADAGPAFLLPRLREAERSMETREQDRNLRRGERYLAPLPSENPPSLNSFLGRVENPAPPFSTVPAHRRPRRHAERAAQEHAHTPEDSPLQG